MMGWVSSCVFKPFSLSGFLSSSLSVLLVDVEVEPTPELLRRFVDAARLQECTQSVQDSVGRDNGTSRAELVQCTVGVPAESFDLVQLGVLFLIFLALASSVPLARSSSSLSE